MLTALSSIASNQAEPTEETMDNIKLFLDYAASHQDDILTYQASDMVLIVHSDASYLSEPKARSRAGGHFFMSSNVVNPHNNSAVLNIAQLIKAVSQFCFYWAPGKNNLGDYWTKHDCAAHHIEKHPTILTPQSIVTALQTSLHRNPNQLAAKAA